MTTVTEPHDVLDTEAAGPAAVRGGVLRIAGYVAGVLLSVGSAALLFRHLGVEDGGRYVTVLSIVALFGGVTDAGLATIAVRELSARPGADARTVMRNVLGLRIALTSVALLAAVGFSAIAGYERAMVAGTALAGVGLLLQSTQLTLGSSLIASMRFGWITALDLARQAITVALIVALVIAGASLLPFLALSIPAGAAVLVATAWLVRRSTPLLPAFDRAAWRRLLRDVLPYAAATAVTAVYFRVAIILVSLISSSEQTGYLGASFRVVEVVVGVPQLAVGAAFPIFARAAGRDEERFGYAIQRVLDASAVFGGLVVVGLVVGAPFVIRVVAGPDFAPAADVLRIQSVGLFASFIAAVWGYALLGLRLHRRLLALTLLTLLVNTVLTLILASLADARGAATATAIGEGVLAIAGAIVIARALPGRGPSGRTVGRVVVAGGVAACLALVHGVPTVALALAAGAVYLAVLWAIRGIPDDLLVDLRRLRPGAA